MCGVLDALAGMKRKIFNPCNFRIRAPFFRPPSPSLESTQPVFSQRPQPCPPRAVPSFVITIGDAGRPSAFTATGVSHRGVEHPSHRMWPRRLLLTFLEIPPSQDLSKSAFFCPRYQHTSISSAALRVEGVFAESPAVHRRFGSVLLQRPYEDTRERI